MNRNNYLRHNRITMDVNFTPAKNIDVTYTQPQDINVEFINESDINIEFINESDINVSFQNPVPIVVEFENWKWPQGIPWPPGGDWLSAYEVAVNNGFVWTEAEWLASLQGEPWSVVHNELTGREANNAHPISSITGLQDELNNKQETLVSGTNIKTVNGDSILWTGDLAISWWSTTVIDTRENIFTLTPDKWTQAFATDTQEIFIYNNKWIQSDSNYDDRVWAVDMGVVQDSNRAWYWKTYISDKRISNSSIWSNRNTEEWGLRLSNVWGLNVLQGYLSWEWRTLLSWINLQLDTEEPDIETLDFWAYRISIFNGNSDEKDMYGTPIVQSMTIDMWAIQSPLILSWWTF